MKIKQKILIGFTTVLVAFTCSLYIFKPSEAIASIIRLITLQGTVLTGNSTTTPLATSTAFTGTSVDILNCGVVFVNVYADSASATDGLSLQQSNDGSNWNHTDDYTYATSSNKNYSINPHAQYFRVVFTNGTTAQSAFRMQAICKTQNAKASSHRIKDTIIGDDDAELVKSAITGEDENGMWYNVDVDQDGHLSIHDQSSGLSIAQGNVTGASFIHKFGAAEDFDTGDGFVTVWDGAEDGEAYEAMQMSYSATANIDYLVAEDSGDNQEVEVQGLDSNFELVVQTKTLTGQTPVALDTPLIRVFRVKNNNSTNFASHVFVYVSAGTTVTAGVPQDGAKVRAVVHADNNQTEMAVFTIPAGKTGYMRSWYGSTAGAKKDSSHTIKLLARPFGGVFQLKHKANIDVNGTSYIQHEYIEPEVFTEKTDIEMQMDTDTDQAGVAGGFDIVLIDN